MIDLEEKEKNDDDDDIDSGGGCYDNGDDGGDDNEGMNVQFVIAHNSQARSLQQRLMMQMEWRDER